MELNFRDKKIRKDDGMDFTKLSLKELREMAKEKGLSGISALRKAELIEELKKAEILSQSVVRPVKPADILNPAELPGKKQAEKPVEKPVEEKKSEPEREKKVYTYVPSQNNNSRNYKGRNMSSHSNYNNYQGNNHQNNNYQNNNYQGNNYQNNNYQNNNYQGNNYQNNNYQNNNYQNNNYHSNAQNNSHYSSQDNSSHDNGSSEMLQEHQPYRTIEEVIKAGLITIAKDRQVLDVHPTELKELDSGITKKGILEIMPEGYAFIRCDNFLPGDNDVYVSPAFLRRFGLRTGDIIEGNLRVRTQNEKFSALLYMTKVNERPITYLAHRNKFEDLTPIFPNERIHLETSNSGVSMRMLDLIAPIGKGQRGMIVSQPKTGKTTLLKQVASAITQNYPDMHLLILLIDERPEEVTDIKESIEGEKVEVIYSTFDELPENHKRVSEMVIERAKRLVEGGDDVVVLLDSITRLARAYNLTVTPSGRTLSGGLDPAALHMPKRFFGAARNMREGGSLTVLATALVDTGSRMDDVVFEEFKGTGNMELVLDRHLSEKRVFPAIDIQKSSTRREDLLLDQNELEAVYIMRKALGASPNNDGNLEQIINLFRRTKNNKEFIETIKKIKLH
ncbi:MAG: transcription termination factor Rho [Eubacterium sp.]